MGHGIVPGIALAVEPAIPITSSQSEHAEGAEQAAGQGLLKTQGSMGWVLGNHLNTPGAHTNGLPGAAPAV